MTQQGTANLAWRSGTKMRKHVMQRKVLIYAILRELPDPSGDFKNHMHASASLQKEDATLSQVVNLVDEYGPLVVACV